MRSKVQEQFCFWFIFRDRIRQEIDNNILSILICETWEPVRKSSMYILLIKLFYSGLSNTLFLPAWLWSHGPSLPLTVFNFFWPQKLPLPIFSQLTFKLGLSYTPLAQAGLDALENWTMALPADELKPYLGEILQCLDSYLKTSGN